MFKLNKELRGLSIAHRLKNYKGKCSNYHGHWYRVEIAVELEQQDKAGLSLDFNYFKVIDNWLQDNWDHITLVYKEDTELLNFLKQENSKYYILEENTTVENMCKELRKIIDENKWLEGLNYKVRIWETPTSSCEL